MRPPIICEPAATAVTKPVTGGLPQWTPRELINFEEDIAAEFNASKIKAPVQLYHGNENEIIDVFKGVRAEDWVLCSWRSHYQCLLKGVPAEEVKAEIMAGHSITLNLPEYRVLSSAIVTGVLTIAGSRSPRATSSSTSAIVCFAAMAITGFMFCEASR